MSLHLDGNVNYLQIKNIELKKLLKFETRKKIRLSMYIEFVGLIPTELKTPHL